MQIKPRGKIYSFNEGGSRDWQEPAKKYLDSLKNPKVNVSFLLQRRVMSRCFLYDMQWRLIFVIGVSVKWQFVFIIIIIQLMNDCCVILYLRKGVVSLIIIQKYSLTLANTCVSRLAARLDILWICQLPECGPIT